jgi:hypothetical protein
MLPHHHHHQLFSHCFFLPFPRNLFRLVEQDVVAKLTLRLLLQRPGLATVIQCNFIKYYFMRRYPVLPGAHIAVRGRRLTWSTMHTRRVFYLHSSTNSSSKLSTIDCGDGFRLFLLGVEINVLDLQWFPYILFHRRHTK